VPFAKSDKGPPNHFANAPRVPSPIGNALRGSERPKKTGTRAMTDDQADGLTPMAYRARRRAILAAAVAFPDEAGARMTGKNRIMIYGPKDDGA
jgi:hypothetical protein